MNRYTFNKLSWGSPALFLGMTIGSLLTRPEEGHWILYIAIACSILLFRMILNKK